MKAGAIFFSEPLPKEFFVESRREALKNVDLLLIVGTSLKVKPFCLLP